MMRKNKNVLCGYHQLQADALKTDINIRSS